MITEELILKLIIIIENEKNEYYQFWIVDIPKGYYKGFVNGSRSNFNSLELNGRTIQLRKRNAFAVIPVTAGNIEKYNI